MYFQSKIYIVNNNVKFFGPGPLTLLKKTEELGSLNKAAIEMKMSYSKAFSMIKKAEKELSMKLLEGHVGGKCGGGSSVTKEGKEFMLKYEEFIRRANQSTEDLYHEIFS